ncbi:hypothetical protein BDB01DRAFT_810319 [Pilobolus umbonatus]|nr:hypothetical protein BDB01DRAFT_810319 [Pilobolus umbonatus]
MHIIAPCPKKPSLYSLLTEEEVDEACQELRQILTTHHHKMDDNSIIRTTNPLPYDSSFIPNIHSLHVDTKHRPRSFSVGDSRNSLNKISNLVH